MFLFKRILTAIPSCMQASYQTKFSHALKRTQHWGLEHPGFKSSSERYLGDQTFAAIHRCINQTFPNVRPEDFAQMCFHASGKIQAPLEDLLGVPLFFTLGYATLDGQPVFHTPTYKLKSMLKRGLSADRMNLHAWLTLPSHEIIDLTLLTSVGVENKVTGLIGKFCVSHPETLPETLAFHPQLVGGDFLRKTGFLLDAPRLV